MGIMHATFKPSLLFGFGTLILLCLTITPTTHGLPTAFQGEKRHSEQIDTYVGNAQETQIEEVASKPEENGEIVKQRSKRSLNRRQIMAFCCNFCKAYSCNVFPRYSLEYAFCAICHGNGFCTSSTMFTHAYC